ncbi:hypothetical protein ACIGHG_23360 [Bacillus sp. NPDC077411]|uniref:hypothetical protein n=1 Tax=Bacillus sp. NPDC077411 TaxID=3363947 RepID=UPI0037CB34B1
MNNAYLQQQLKKTIAVLLKSDNQSTNVKLILHDLHKNGLITEEELNYMNELVHKKTGLVS